MFIEISKELAELISQEYSTGVSQISDAINSLLDSMYKRKHIVMLNRDALFILKKCESLSLSSQIVLQWIENHYYDINAIKKKVAISVVLIPEVQSYIQGNVYYLSIFACEEFFQTELLTENDDDCIFYKNIYSFFNPSKKVFDVSLHNNPFYGGNVAARIKSEYEEKKFFLCIVDSDKEYSADAKGSTYQGANNELKEHKDEILPHDLYVLNVREKENLFPFHFYKSNCSEQNKFIDSILMYATEEVFRFIKIKEGIKIKRIKEADSVWDSLYGDIIKDCKRKLIYIYTAKDDECCIKGINSRALKRASDPFFSNNNYNSLQEQTKLDTIFGKQSFIIEEWKEIAHKLFDYGCCLSRNVNFLA